MMNRRLFLRLLLALSAAVGMSGSVLLLLERLGLLDSAQRPQIEAQRAEFEKAARKANTIEGAIVSRDGIPFTSASEPGKPALVTALCYSSLVGYRTSTSSSGLRREFGDTLYYAREEGGRHSRQSGHDHLRRAPADRIRSGKGAGKRRVLRSECPDRRSLCIGVLPRGRGI